jgi:hypothetical protein
MRKEGITAPKGPGEENANIFCLFCCCAMVCTPCAYVQASHAPRGVHSEGHVAHLLAALNVIVVVGIIIVKLDSQMKKEVDAAKTGEVAGPAVPILELER